MSERNEPRPGGSDEGPVPVPSDLFIRNNSDPLWISTAVVFIWVSLGIHELLQGDAPSFWLAGVLLLPVVWGLAVYSYFKSFTAFRGDTLTTRATLLRRESSIHLSEVTGREFTERHVKLEREGQEPFVIKLGQFKKADAERLVKVLKDRLAER